MLHKYRYQKKRAILNQYCIELKKLVSPNLKIYTNLIYLEAVYFEGGAGYFHHEFTWQNYFKCATIAISFEDVDEIHKLMQQNDKLILI